VTRPGDRGSMNRGSIPRDRKLFYSSKPTVPPMEWYRVFLVGFKAAEE